MLLRKPHCGRTFFLYTRVRISVDASVFLKTSKINERVLPRDNWIRKQVGDKNIEINALGAKEFCIQDIFIQFILDIFIPYIMNLFFVYTIYPEYLYTIYHESLFSLCNISWISLYNISWISLYNISWISLYNISWISF